MSNRTIEHFLSHTDILNLGYTIKLRYRTLSNGSLSLFLDYWTGKTRLYHFFKQHLKNLPESYLADRKILKTTLLIRSKKEAILKAKKHNKTLEAWEKKNNQSLANLLTTPTDHNNEATTNISFSKHSTVTKPKKPSF